MTDDDVFGPLPLEGVVPFGPPPVSLTVDKLAKVLGDLGFPEGVVRLTTEVTMTPGEFTLEHADPTVAGRRIRWAIPVTRP